MKARGNRIGSITDLKTSCIAAGRPDLAYKLVEQLQNALDSLKHRVEIDESVVSEIRKEVAPAPWLRYKRERRVSDLPAHLEVADTDKVGRLYNLLRKELGFLPDETGNGFEEKMGIEDFRGLFSGEHVTREMFEECQLVNSIYGDIASRIVQREDDVKQQLKDTQAQWEPESFSLPGHEPGCMCSAPVRAADFARESQESPDQLPDLRGLQSAASFRYFCHPGRIRRARSCSG